MMMLCVTPSASAGGAGVGVERESPRIAQAVGEDFLADGGGCRRRTATRGAATGRAGTWSCGEQEHASVGIEVRVQRDAEQPAFARTAHREVQRASRHRHTVLEDAYRSALLEHDHAPIRYYSERLGHHPPLERRTQRTGQPRAIDARTTSEIGNAPAFRHTMVID